MIARDLTITWRCLLRNLKPAVSKRNYKIPVGEEGIPGGHPNEGDLHRYVLGHLSPTDVEVLEEHVFQCPACKDRLATVIMLVIQIDRVAAARSGADRRTEPRFRTSDTGFLRSFAALMPDRWPVQVVDVSKNGLGLVVAASLAEGSWVQVQVGNAFALGEVRHSTPIDDQRFRIGIRLADIVGRT
jgi:Putative zinc-finger/PilZ domain